MRISDWSSDVCSSDLRYLITLLVLYENNATIFHLTEVFISWAFNFASAPEVLRCATFNDSLLKPEVGSKGVDSIRSRSEERRVGKECVSTCRSRWSQDH